MKENKLTPEEIKKALECCADEMGCAKGCPFFDKKKSKCKVASPYGAFEKLLLDLLNRQQAEIERLKKTMLVIDNVDVSEDELREMIRKMPVLDIIDRYRQGYCTANECIEQIERELRDVA